MERGRDDVEGFAVATVHDEDKCPSCGERRMDYLEWDADGETVTCATCGHRYAPGRDARCER